MRAAGVGLVLVLAAACAWAQQTSRVDGCLALRDKLYVLVQGQPRTIYRLEGQPQQLKQHLGELVRIEGRVTPGRALRVAKVDKLAPDCSTMIPPGSATDSVAGKVGNEQVQIPVSTTGTAGETTPGYQTPAGRAQPGTNTQPSTALPQSKKHQPGAPPDWEQAGQTPEQANTIAQAAQRAQVQPGRPLGTNPAAPQSSGERPPQTPLRTPPRAVETGVVQVTDQGCQPAKVTISPGEAVQWVNESRQSAQVNSAETEPRAQNGSNVFGSGAIPAGEVFRHVFDRTGTYRYTCSATNGQHGAGEVEVKP